MKTNSGKLLIYTELYNKGLKLIFINFPEYFSRSWLMPHLDHLNHCKVVLIDRF